MNKQALNKLQSGDENFISDLNAALMYRTKKLPLIIISLMAMFVVFLVLWGPGAPTGKSVVLLVLGSSGAATGKSLVLLVLWAPRPQQAKA